MFKFFLLILFTIGYSFTFGQGKTKEEYIGVFYLLDSIKNDLVLSLNCDKSFKFNSNFLQATGKWSKISDKALKLRVGYSKMGCIASNKKTKIKFLIDADRIILNKKALKNKRKTQRELRKSTGERINLTYFNEKQPFVMDKSNSFSCQ